jgi:hypothetical protein
MKIEVFRPFHVELLRAQGVQGEQMTELGDGINYAGERRPLGPAFTASSSRGLILLCGGIVQLAPHRGLCWALLSKEAPRHLLSLHKATRRFLQLYSYPRVETTVRAGFMPGCRWVEMLGFRFEGDMPLYGDQGETHWRYARLTPR